MSASGEQSGNGATESIAGIEELRDRIDRIDSELLELLNRRIRCAIAIGDTKRRAGSADYYRPEREAQILKRLLAQNTGPLSADALERLFKEIVSVGRGAETGLSIAYLGPEGSYSHSAVLRHFGHAVSCSGQGTIDEVFSSVESDVADFGVVPVENSLEGGVTFTLDRFVQSPVRVCGEVLVPIRHCLLSRVTDLDLIQEVHGHPHALAQCRGWLSRRLSRAAVMTANSSSEAARRASESAALAAIAGETAAQVYDLPVVVRHIADGPGNTTRFFVIGNLVTEPSGSDKTSFLLSTRNRPGALYKLLAPLAEHGVSMTRIESRPSRTGLWEYVFFVDVEGHIDDEPLASAFRRLQEEASLAKVLGSYPRAMQ